MVNRGRGSVAVFMAPGMNVPGEAQKLRKKANKLEGILELDINYILNTVSIRYDSDRVTLDTIKKTIGTQIAPQSP